MYDRNFRDRVLHAENLISNYDRLVEFNLNEDFIENKSGFKNLTKCHKNESASQMCVKSFDI